MTVVNSGLKGLKGYCKKPCTTKDTQDYTAVQILRAVSSQVSRYMYVWIAEKYKIMYSYAITPVLFFGHFEYNANKYIMFHIVYIYHNNEQNIF